MRCSTVVGMMLGGALPSMATAQATCTGRDGWTPWQATGYKTVEARCSCGKTGRAHNQWMVQLKNVGDVQLVLRWVITSGTTPDVPKRTFTLGPRQVSVTEFSKAYGCRFGSEAFVTAEDVPQRAGDEADGTLRVRKEGAEVGRRR